MDKVNVATECLHSGMTEPTIWQRSCNLSCERNAFQGEKAMEELNSHIRVLISLARVMLFRDFSLRKTIKNWKRVLISLARGLLPSEKHGVPGTGPG